MSSSEQPPASSATLTATRTADRAHRRGRERGSIHMGGNLLSMNRSGRHSRHLTLSYLQPIVIVAPIDKAPSSCPDLRCVRQVSGPTGLPVRSSSWGGIDADGAPHASLNHYSKGAVISFLHRYVAGVQLMEPGYRRFRVAPMPGGSITSARSSHDSPYGRIEVAWHLDAGAGRGPDRRRAGASRAVRTRGRDDRRHRHRGHRRRRTTRPGRSRPAVALRPLA